MNWLLLFLVVFLAVSVLGGNAEASTVTSSEALLGGIPGLVYVGGFSLVLASLFCFWMASKANAEMKNKRPDFRIAQELRAGKLCFKVYARARDTGDSYIWIHIGSYQHFYQALNSRGFKCVSDDCGLTYYLNDGRECSYLGRPLKRT